MSVASVNGGGDASAESDSDEDENKIVEESPCGRWSKRKAQVRCPFFSITIYTARRLKSVMCPVLILPISPWTMKRDRKLSGMRCSSPSERTSDNR